MGQALAMHELQLGTAELVQRVDFAAVHAVEPVVIPRLTLIPHESSVQMCTGPRVEAVERRAGSVSSIEELAGGEATGCRFHRAS